MAVATERTADGWERITFNGRDDLWEGEPVVARVETPTRKLQLVPNQLGEFPRVFVPEKTTVSVRVRYPDARAGDKVAVAPLDGGQFADGSESKVLIVSADQTLDFTFTVSWQNGTHRVLLRRPNLAPTILDFWAGEHHTYDLARR